MPELTGIFKQLEEHTFTADECFLCGCVLVKENKTEEHVIPKWLQSKFNLWDQQITLLNGTYLPYRLLTIPCCKTCNNIYLSPFEIKVNKAFNGGFEVFKNLDKKTLFLWLGKIYFGLLYKELFLSLDRKNPKKGTILTSEYMNFFYNHFLFLQGIREKHVFNGFFPASIYLFKTQLSNIIENQWDIFDNQSTMFISIRMGEIGIIAALQDCETIIGFGSAYDQHREIDLHPLQFREIAAKLLYSATLMNRTPKFINIQNSNNGIVETTLMPLMGVSTKYSLNQPHVL